MPTSTTQPRTLGELRASGYRSKSVRAEILDNLQRRLRGGEGLFEGILGYDDSVVPAVENALLIFLYQIMHKCYHYFLPILYPLSRLLNADELLLYHSSLV